MTLSRRKFSAEFKLRAGEAGRGGSLGRRRGAAT